MTVIKFALSLAMLSPLAVAAASANPSSPAAEAPWRATVRAFSKEHFRNPAWGYSHSERDYTLARSLASADGARLDDDVLFAAAFLHDMAAFAPWAKDGVDHADQAASTIDEVLKGSGFPKAKMDAVRGAIKAHMYFRDPAGAGPEALYLHDADALDWLGAIGVARVMALADPKGGAPDGPAVVQMLDTNLATVPARVLSPAGKALVPGRVAELKQFLDALRQESDGLKTL